MAITLKEFVNKIGWDIDYDQLRAGMSKAGQTLERLQPMAQKMTAFVSVPLLAFAGLSVKLASDAQEVSSKFDTVFRDIQEQAGATADSFARDFGLAGSSAKQFIGDTSDLLTGFGFTQEGALELSDQVNRLAVDLASFTNYSGGAKGASEALTKALLGETDSLKSLGIAILQKDVQEQIAIDRANGLFYATERQAKAQATMRIALRQSQNAIGDYARTSDDFANSSRRVRERLKELSETIGAELLPFVNKLAHGIEWLTNIFIEMPQPLRMIAIGIGAVLIIIPPLLMGIYAITTAVATLGTTVVVATAGLALLIPIAIALIVLWVKLAQKYFEFIKGLAKGNGALASIKESIISVVTSLKEMLAPAIVFIKAYLEVLWVVVKEVFGAIMTVVGFVIGIVVKHIANMAKMFAFYFGHIATIVSFVLDKLGVKFKGSGERFRAGLIAFLTMNMVVIKTLALIVEEEFGKIIGKIDEVSDKMKEADEWLTGGIDKIVDVGMKVTGQGQYGVEQFDATALRERLRSDNASTGGTVQQTNNVTIGVPEGTSQQQQDALRRTVETTLPSALTGELNRAMALTAGTE